MKRLASIVKDGLRGGILLGGSVSFLCSGGCLPAASGVAGYYYGKDRARQEAAVEVANNEMGNGSIGGTLYVEIYNDINNNGRPDEATEIIGSVDGPIDFDECDLSVQLATHYGNEIVYSLYDSNSKLISRSVGTRGQNFNTQNGSPDNFVGKLRELGAGEYTIKVYHATKTHSQIIRVI